MFGKDIMPLQTLRVFALFCCAGAAFAQEKPPAAAPDPISSMVGRLDLERYKATIKGLTQFGDRREGTDRNRAAIDWIEAKPKSYGCTNTERIHYDYQQAAGNGGGRGGGGNNADPSAGPGG